jgi:ABC-type dipeptide/oligopeptide/nickel transport system permease subunit
LTDFVQPNRALLVTELAPSVEEQPNFVGDDEVVGITVTSVSPRRQAYLRFKQHRAAVVSVFVLTFLVIAVILTPITARYGVNEPVIPITEGKNQFLPPFNLAWFGTDDIGRDLYSRLLYGIRVSLVIGLASAIISVVIGVAVGAIAGLRGGWFDDIMMRITDIFLAFPILVSLLVMRNVLGAVSWMKPIIGELSSVRFLIFLFAIFGWMGVARVVRAQVLALKEREFIEASRAIGAKNGHIIRRHMLPNSVGPILVALSLSVVGAIIAESTLSLFGYGPNVGAGSTSLGLLVGGSAKAARAGYWWLVVFPFAALLVITLCISFIGDGLRDATDPKASGGRT